MHSVVFLIYVHIVDLEVVGGGPFGRIVRKTLVTCLEACGLAQYNVKRLCKGFGPLLFFIGIQREENVTVAGKAAQILSPDIREGVQSVVEFALGTIILLIIGILAVQRPMVFNTLRCPIGIIIIHLELVGPAVHI